MISFISSGYKTLQSRFNTINRDNRDNPVNPNQLNHTDRTSSEMLTLPQDVWNQILIYSKTDYVAIACVSKSLNGLTHAFAKNIFPEGCFGQKEWKHFGVDLGDVFPISLKIIQNFDPQKWMLTFIPETINNEKLTLNSLEVLVGRHTNKRKHLFKSCYRMPLNQVGITDQTITPFKAHWVMLSKDVFGGDDLTNGTRNKIYEEQELLVKKAGYEIPTLIDAVVSLLMHQLKTGEYLYQVRSKESLLTYTHVQEKNVYGHRITVGCFDSALGLLIYHEKEGISKAQGASKIEAKSQATGSSLACTSTR